MTEHRTHGCRRATPDCRSRQYVHRRPQGRVRVRRHPVSRARCFSMQLAFAAEVAVQRGLDGVGELAGAVLLGAHGSPPPATM